MTFKAQTLAIALLAIMASPVMAAEANLNAGTAVGSSVTAPNGNPGIVPSHVEGKTEAAVVAPSGTVIKQDEKKADDKEALKGTAEIKADTKTDLKK